MMKYPQGTLSIRSTEDYLPEKKRNHITVPTEMARHLLVVLHRF